MEKRSEKLIRETSPLKDRFKHMLSEVQLKVPPQVQTKKKPNNLVLDNESYFDKSGTNIIQADSAAKAANSKNQSPGHMQQKQNQFAFNVSLKTKKTSLLKQLIPNQNVLNQMRSRNLLGRHWQSKLRLRNMELLYHSFNLIKNSMLSQNYTFNKLPSIHEFSKIHQLTTLLQTIQQLRIRACFQQLAQAHKDSVLLELSNTAGDIKDNSLLKLESQYGCLALQTGLQLKKELNSNDKDISMGKSSKKVCEPTVSYQSLSGLILNHNKLNIPLEAIQEYPNIPKSNKNISHKLIPSSKEIAELSLQTKKLIETNKPLDFRDLPLQTKKNLNERGHKQTSKQSILHNEKPANSPITFTYILKNLDFTKLMPNNLSKDSIRSNNHIQNELKLQIQKRRANRAQQHHHQPSRNIFLEVPHLHIDKRAASLQIKHFPGLCISPEKNNQPLFMKQYNNQYYNQYNSNRQNLRRISFANIGTSQAKQRPRSATPKITFNFCSSNQQLPIPRTNNAPVQNEQAKVKYQEADCIVQKSLLHDKNSYLLQLNSQKEVRQHVKHNRFQIISPSHRKQQKNIHQKMKNEQKMYIKQKILPPVANQYYNNEPIPLKTQRKIPILSASNTSTAPCHEKLEIKQTKKNPVKQSKKSIVNEFYFGEIQLQQEEKVNAFCRIGGQNIAKLKSQKEKILVTYSSKKIA